MSAQSQSVEELKSCIKESMEDTMERKCPFCLQNISPLKLLAHNRLCMYLWEEQLEMDHVSHVTHSEGILEKESKKRKLQETEFVGLQLSNSPSQIIGSSSSNASSSSSTILNNPSIASSSTNSSTTVLPFLDRERYYEETEHKKKKEKAKGLCCFDPKVCPLAKRKSNPQTIKIILHGMTINVCKIAHFTSNTTRALLIEKNKLAIQKATKASKAIPKTTVCTECSEQCAGLFKIQSRDSQRSIDFCSMACLLRHMQITKTSGWNAWVKKYGKKARSSATNIDSQLSQILADDDEEGEDEETDTHDVEEAEHMEQAENDDTESD